MRTLFAKLTVVEFYLSPLRYVTAICLMTCTDFPTSDCSVAMVQVTFRLNEHSVSEIQLESSFNEEFTTVQSISKLSIGTFGT